MSKAIDPRAHNVVNYLNVYTSANDNISTLSDRIDNLDEVEKLLMNIKREHQDFDLANWINCNNLKGKTEREIFISLSEQYNKNIIENKRCLNSINKLSPIIKENFSNHGYSTDSLNDFFQEVKKSIVAGKNDYLDIIKFIFSHYMDYVRELRTTITLLSEHSKAGKKDGYLAVNFIEFKKELEKIRDDYLNKVNENPFFKGSFKFEYDNGYYIRKIESEKIIYSSRNQVNHTLKTVEKLLSEIKGIKIIKNENLSEVKNNIDINFTGNIDFDDLNKFISKIKTDISLDGILSDADIEKKRKKLLYENTSLLGFIRPGFDIDAEIRKIIAENEERKKESKYKNISQTEFDLFKKSLDSLEKKINNNLDELSKKYSSANSNYDNFVKIVSSTMNTLLEMAKGFLRF